MMQKTSAILALVLTVVTVTRADIIGEEIQVPDNQLPGKRLVPCQELHIIFGSRNWPLGGDSIGIGRHCIFNNYVKMVVTSGETGFILVMSAELLIVGTTEWANQNVLIMLFIIYLIYFVYT
jgi:hypothetical protein